MKTEEITDWKQGRKTNNENISTFMNNDISFCIDIKLYSGIQSVRIQCDMS